MAKSICYKRKGKYVSSWLKNSSSSKSLSSTPLQIRLFPVTDLPKITIKPKDLKIWNSTVISHQITTSCHQLTTLPTIREIQIIREETWKILSWKNSIARIKILSTMRTVMTRLIWQKELTSQKYCLKAIKTLLNKENQV